MRNSLGLHCALFRRIGLGLVGVALVGLVPVAPAPANASGVSADDAAAPSGLYRAEIPTEVAVDITRWKIQKKLTVGYDLTRMAAVTGISVSRERDAVHTRKMGSYWAATLWDGKGMSDHQDVKIGTAVLAQPARANMVVDFTAWYAAATRADAESTGTNQWSGAIGSSGSDSWYLGSESKNKVRLVLFKGSRIADVYGQFALTVLKPGKKVSSSGSLQFAKPRKLALGKKYRATDEPTVTYDSASPPTTTPVIEIYYKNTDAFAKVAITAPSIHQKVGIYVKNTKQTLHAKLESKNPIYKRAKKLVGDFTASCNHTVALAWKAPVSATIDGNSSLNLPLGAARTGDAVVEPGHISLYTGPGAMAIHGDVFTNKTFRQNAPLRDGYYVQRPFSNVFRFH